MSAESDAVTEIVAWAKTEQERLQFMCGNERINHLLDRISDISRCGGGYDDDPFEGEDG